MIKKIVQISGVGRFNFKKEDYQSDIPEFDHSTVIYADNTMGKSTLSDIFRSLTEEKNLIIKDRKTIDSDKGQLIKIEIDQQDFIFANGRWIERDNPSIQIFDETFVNVSSPPNMARVF